MARRGDIYGWPLHPLVRSFRLLAQQTFLWMLVRLFYRVHVSGRENLRGLRGPVLFVPNHCLHSDNGILLTTIPLSWRWKLAVAAGADDIFGSRLRGTIAAILANAFPLARKGTLRRSMELVTARLDRRFSLLIYPEGKMTLGGPMQPFRPGAGLIAVRTAAPVVPVKLKVRHMSVIDRRGSRLRGEVEVVFGAPLRFGVETPPATATLRLQEAVAAL